MRYLIAGSSGFLGTALREHLARQGHDVTRLVRGEAASVQESRWDPYAGQVDQAVVDTADVVVNLAGAPLAHWPWTESYQKVFRESRTATTRTLAEAVARAPQPKVFLAQSGIAGYGDRGDAVLTEDSPNDADTLFGSVTRDWEAATEPARAAGSRVVVLRTGVVLGRSGGALKPLLTVFKLGGGGRLGSGKQYMATISLQDWLEATVWLAENPEASGAYNLTGPEPGTNAAFTKTLGRLLHRPTFLPVPAAPIKALLGPASPELLGSTRAVPARLEAEGYVFAHRTVDTQLAAALG